MEPLPAAFNIHRLQVLQATGYTISLYLQATSLSATIYWLCPQILSPLRPLIHPLPGHHLLTKSYCCQVLLSHYQQTYHTTVCTS